MTSNPRIIPVLDVMGGEVVHAVGGDRTSYWPVKSRLTDSTRPLDVARALLAASGANELYVADLDAIRWGIGDEGVGELLEELDCRLLIDQGGLGAQPPAPNVREIYALECRLGAEKYIRHARTKGAIFSIELRDGRMVNGWQDWGVQSPTGALGVVRKAYDIGYRAFVILDLARVGVGRGPGTESLIRAIRDEFADVELITGGGVKSWADIEKLGACGADAVLVASALHDGTLTSSRPAS
jgi:phosphoribosylformimino-5-aminoimidazole carboxamide ribotide isomerase